MIPARGGPEQSESAATDAVAMSLATCYDGPIRDWKPVLHAGRCNMVHRLLSCLILALAVTLPAATTHAVGDPTTEFATPPMRETVAPRDLREVLALAEADLPLRVRLLSRAQQEGYPWRVEGDTLRLVPPAAHVAGGSAPADSVLVAVPLDEIVAVWQQRSGLRSGLNWGAKSGAIVGGGLGLLIGAALTALADDDSDAAPIMAASLVFAAAGAAGGTLVGGVVGALTSDWYVLWPPEGDVAPEGGVEGETARARWCLEPGWSFTPEAGVDGNGPSLRATILKRLGRRFELGPCLEVHDIEGGTWQDSYYGGPYLSHRSREFGLGVDVRLNERGAGLRPLGTVGLGWFVGNDLRLGAHLGAGVRWRGARGPELSLAARRFVPLTGGEFDEARFWAVSAGITLGY